MQGRLARGSAAALGIFIASAGLAYCTQLSIARMVGAEGYGQYAYVFAWMTVLAYFSALGFDVSLLRFVPSYRAQRAYGLMRGVLRYAQRMVVAVGVMVAVLGASFMALWNGHLPVALSRTFLIGFTLVPIWALLWVRCSIARAFGGVVSALAPERIVRDGLLLCLLGFAGPVLGWRLGAPTTMGATAISSTVALCLVSVAARRLRSPEVSQVAPDHATATWLLAAAPLMLIGTVEPLMNRIGVMLLGWVGDIKGAGIYAVVFNMAFLAVLPRTAVNALFAPTVAELFARGDRSGLQALILRTSIWTLAGSLCIALPLWFLATPILAWFGPAFAAGAGGIADPAAWPGDRRRRRFAIVPDDDDRARAQRSPAGLSERRGQHSGRDCHYPGPWAGRCGDRDHAGVRRLESGDGAIHLATAAAAAGCARQFSPGPSGEHVTGGRR